MSKLREAVQTLDVIGVLLGFLMLIAVAVVNSYIAFFSTRDYTWGMFAASFFWSVIGALFLRGPSRG